MTPKIISEGILRALAILAGIVLVLFFLYKIQSVLAYLAIAAVVALLGRPIVLFMRRRLRMPNIAAVVFTMLIMVGILVGIVALFIPLLTEQGKNLALLDIEELQRNLNRLYWEVSDFFSAPPEVVN
jgi:predicted PurR-regulated permease PerM